jgi:tRNA G10  N-methylase Trm11
MPNTYLFLLGRTPQLSIQEISALLPSPPSIILESKVVSSDFTEDSEAISFFDFLGGSVKLMKLEGQFTDLSEDSLLDHAVAYLAQSNRPTFATAEFGRENIPRLETTTIKKKLKERGISSRFMESPREGLSAAVLIHQKNIIELNIIQNGNVTYFAQTLASQDIDDWTVRDRVKPYADRKKGMLPPKVARIMVNLAVGHLQKQNPQQEQTCRIYDPFCGSGTVLLEAAMRGCNVLGSDLDQKAVQGTQANVEWFKKIYNKSELQSHVFKADVASVKPQQLDGEVQAIVTEPFLGKPTPEPTELPNIFKGVEKMYIGAFKLWSRLLKNGSRVVIVFPYAQHRKHIFSLEGMIDKLSEFGYTPISEPVFYHRPQAVIQRQIWTFTLKK